MEPVGRTDGTTTVSASRAETVLAGVGKIALVLLALIVATGVVSRALWSNVVPDDVLMVSELMLVAILAPLALVTALREHIAVSIFTDRAGALAQKLLSVLGHLVGIGFFGVLGLAYGKLLQKSWGSGEIYESDLQIPQWPGHALALLFVLAVVLRLCVLLYRDTATSSRDSRRT